jgi:hypothetical protein
VLTDVPPERYEGGGGEVARSTTPDRHAPTRLQPTVGLEV